METPLFKLKDLYRFTFCVFLLFIMLAIRELNFSQIGNFLINILSPNLSNYPYTNPPIFFSIGEALSAIAILFAIYQFKEEKWSLALKIRSYIKPVTFLCVLFGVILSIYSAAFYVRNPSNIFQLSIFWQILASLFIGFSIVFLLFKAKNKKLFSKKNYVKFYEILSQEISRPNIEKLNLTLNVLLDNFESICKTITNPDSEPEIKQYAQSTLNVMLSERSIVNLLTTKRLDAILYILACAEKYNLSPRHSSKGIPLMVKGLFYNTESFLYKHLDNSGLALSSNVYERLFESDILLKNFDFFGYPTLGFSTRGNTDSGTVDVFIESVSRSMKTYLKTGTIPARHINNGISYLSKLFGEICYQIKKDQDLGKDTKFEPEGKWWSLHKLANFFGHDYPYLGDKEELNIEVAEKEKSAREADFHSYSTVNEAVAAFLYKCFEELSRIEKESDTYHIVLDLLEGITSEPNLKKGYAEPFEKRMWQQIGGNVLGHHYPVVLNSYLSYIGFCLAGDNTSQRTGWAGIQAERMRRLLYVDLKPQLDRDEKMVDGTLMKKALLPDCMKYENGKFTYTMGFGRGPVVEIEPPPGTPLSGLDGINWQHPRNLLP